MVNPAIDINPLYDFQCCDIKEHIENYRKRNWGEEYGDAEQSWNVEKDFA